MRKGKEGAGSYCERREVGASIVREGKEGAGSYSIVG